MKFKDISKLGKFIKNYKIDVIIMFFKLLFNFASKDNFAYFENRVTKYIQRGMVFGYNEIEFYVKDFTSNPKKIEKKFNNFEHNIFVVCEYYDIERKKFVEKILHEDFVKYRIKVWKGIILNKES